MLASPPQIVFTNITENIYEYIKSEILTLRLPPGEKINIKYIKEKLNVSPTPIKDALFKLAGEGLVEIIPRRGTYVTSISEKDINEIMQARIVLESGAIDLLPPKLSEEQLAKLSKLYRATRPGDFGMEFKEFMAADQDFHQEIVEMSGNRLILDMYNRMNPHMRLFLYRFVHRSNEKLSFVDSDHKQILASLQKGDHETAKRTLLSHLEKTLQGLLDHYQKDNA